MTVIAVLATVTIVLGGFGYYRFLSGVVITGAIQESVRLCRVMTSQQSELLRGADSAHSHELTLRGEDVPALDRNLRHFLRPFGIVKIKIYDHHRKIIYSTEPRLIGRVDSGNSRLERALSGISDAHLKSGKTMRDLADEELIDVDVVEAYVPVTSETGTVLGCFEVYVNVTHYREQLRHNLILMGLLLGFLCTLLAGGGYLLLRRSRGALADTRAQLERLAITDSLTDVANSTHLLARGQEEFERIRRAQLTRGFVSHLGCVIVDLDHFRKINDSRGHRAGDCVLKGAAQRIRECVRPYDIVGRFSGKGFVVLLPETSLEQSLAIAERIRSAIGERPFECRSEQLQATASLGVSSSNENDRDLEDVLKRAGEGIGKAKSGGGDRVAWVYHPYDSQLHS